MSDGFAYLDILFFAMVAAFIAFRLRAVLGRRHGHERRRPSPIGQPSRPNTGDTPAPLPETASTASSDEDGLGDDFDAAVKTGLTEIRLADPRFDLDGFLEGAKAAFTMILDAFAKSDKASLEPLLAPDVYRSFDQAIDQRETANQSLTTEIVSLAAAELAEATMRGTLARLTVRFTSEQINVLRSADGEVVDGDPAEPAKIVDLWTFERDTRSRDPNWLLVETRSPE